MISPEYLKITNKRSDDGGTTSWDNKNKNTDSVNNRVRNNEEENTVITERPVKIKLRMLNTKVGHNFEVSLLLKCLITRNQLEHHEPTLTRNYCICS